MNIDEFLAKAPLSLLAFKNATMEMAKTNKTFHLNRTETDWWREVAAYHEYVETEERFHRE